MVEEVSGVDVSLSPSTATSRDPSVVSSSIRPTSDASAWAANGSGQANTSGDAAVALGCDPYITGTATSTYVGRGTTSRAASTMVDAMSTVRSLVCPVVSSATTAVTGYSAIIEGVPCVPTSACATEGTGDATGSA